MKLALITPTAFVAKFGSQGDFHLGLSHLISLKEENDYEKALKRQKLAGKSIVLDNGLFENDRPEATASLMQKAIKIGASVVFAPDHLYDSKKTKFALGVAIYELEQQQLKGKIKIGAVVQADNDKDWLAQYDEFKKIPEVELIGLSILSIPKSFTKKTGTENITVNRLYLLKELLKRGDNTKKCHLLGLGDSFEDVIFAAKNCPFVYSNDTSSAFQSGLFGKRLTDKLEVPGGKVKEKVDFDLKEINSQQATDIQFNISQIKKYAN